MDSPALRGVDAFEAEQAKLASRVPTLSSNGVLAVVRHRLVELGFAVQSGTREQGQVPVPVLFGKDGKVEKCFYADAYHAGEGFVLEVEAGRGVVNNQFLKDLFRACMMNEVRHVAIALRTIYRRNTDFETVCRFPIRYMPAID